MKKKYNSLVEESKNLYRLYAKDPKPILLTTIEELDDEINQITKMIDNENNSISVIKEKQAFEENIKPIIKNLRGRWDDLTIKERQNAIRICIKSITIKYSSIDINYNL